MHQGRSKKASIYDTDMKADIYYDRSIRLWTLLWKDEEDNQVGDAEYYDSKKLAMYFAKRGFSQK